MGESWTNDHGWMFGAVGDDGRTDRKAYEQPLLSAAIHTFAHLENGYLERDHNGDDAATAAAAGSDDSVTDSIASAMQKQSQSGGYGSASTSPSMSPVASPKAADANSNVTFSFSNSNGATVVEV